VRSIETFALWLILIFTICSCDSSIKADFTVTNSTNFKIDSLTILAKNIENHQYISLAPLESKTFQIDITNYPFGDGDFKLRYVLAGKKHEERFGYITGRHSINEETFISIEMDTVKYQSTN